MTSCMWIFPEPGTQVSAGQPFGEVESTKSVSDVYAPVSGTIVERNGALEDKPELVNEQPYGDGWLVAIEPSEAAELEHAPRQRRVQGARLQRLRGPPAPLLDPRPTLQSRSRVTAEMARVMHPRSRGLAEGSVDPSHTLR